MIGQTISHYRITEQLGSGGMGVVYKAEDTNLDRTVALKFLAPHLLDSEEHKLRFLREAKAAASLDHPNICMIHEVGEADGRVFLSMGFIDGPEVKAKIRERPLKLDEALDIAIQGCEGLRAAHGKGVVHRDIKSANLMLTSSGQVKIMDFGLAQLSGGTRLTKADAALGTPAYMSPEQAQRRPADERTDIWSLGVVLYEMVTGRLPFEGEREGAIVHSIIYDQHEPVTAMRAGIPLELDRIIAKALAKNPEERYQHVADMLVDLRALRSGVTVARPPSRRRWLWATLIPVIVGVGLFAWRAQRTPESAEPARTVALTTFSGPEKDPARALRSSCE
jgi:serine/threonine protein kinase